MKQPVFEQRARFYRLFTAGPLDLLVIGGGIVGAGIARDAALRGLRVGLVEQHDFAFGTSSRSSRLLHGGLRYLAQGRIGLVREASKEKRILRQIAPHLSEPLAFVFPTYRGTDWPLWQLRVGVKIYDLLCSRRNLGKSSSLNRAQVLEWVPGLKEDRLTGAVRYFDALTCDARLVIDTLRSAANAGALLFNYLKLLDARRAAGGWACAMKDCLTAQTRTILARATVNATGPWADRLPHSAVKLRLTKGIHLVVNRTRLPVPDAVVMTDEQRILFVIPWGQRVIIGTTDTDYQGPIEAVHSEPQDAEYLLRIVNHFFPRGALSTKDIIASWAGLRPLMADSNGNPSDISRSHQIRTLAQGWWDVTGGKLTTYRLIAEQTVDQIVKWLKKLNQFHRQVHRCRTAEDPLLPPEQTDGVSGIMPPEFSGALVEHYCAREWAVHLDDVMLRRTGWHFYYPDADQKAEQVADWMAQLLGWMPPEKVEELNRYRNVVDSFPRQAAKGEPAHLRLP